MLQPDRTVLIIALHPGENHLLKRWQQRNFPLSNGASEARLVSKGVALHSWLAHPRDQSCYSAIVSTNQVLKPYEQCLPSGSSVGLIMK